LRERKGNARTEWPGRFFVCGGGPLRSPKDYPGAGAGSPDGEVQGQGRGAGAGSVSIDMTRETGMTGMTGQLYGLTIHRCCESSAVVKEVREIATPAGPTASELLAVGSSTTRQEPTERSLATERSGWTAGDMRKGTRRAPFDGVDGLAIDVNQGTAGLTLLVRWHSQFSGLRRHPCPLDER